MSVLLTSQFYSPSTIIMVDMDENRLELAKTLGATHTVNSAVENAEEAIKKLPEKKVWMLLSRQWESRQPDICQKIVKPGGHLANVGVHGVKVDFEIQKLWIKNLTITTGLVNTNTTPMLLKATATNKLPLKSLITHHYKLDQIEEAYQVFLNGAKEKAMKIIIEVN
jgi:alcohol dehydrogenase